MTSPTQPPPSWFRRHRLALLGWGGIVLLLLLLLALGQLQRHLTQRKIDTKLAAIRAQGLPVTLAELDIFYSHVPAADNGVLLLLQHQNHYVEWDEINAPWIGHSSSNSIMTVTNPITPAARAALKFVIVSNQTSLRFVYDAVTKPKWRYPADLNHGVTNLFPNLFIPRQVIKLLRIESLHHLAEGRHSDALRSVGTSFQVSDSLALEPLLISFMVRNASSSLSVRNAEMLLQRDQFPSSDLSRLQQLIAESESKTDALRVFHGERAFITGTWNEPVSQHLGWGFAPATPFDDLPEPVHELGWNYYERGGAKEVDLLNFLSLSEELESSLKMDPLDSLQLCKSFEIRFPSSSKPSMSMIMTTYLSSTLPKIAEQNANIIAQFRTAQTALAIERFRMENQRLPQTLGELIPQYLKSAPLDPFTEAPLLYRITTTGFRVYSVGENALDDGGLSRDEALSVQMKSDDILFTIERLKTP